MALSEKNTPGQPQLNNINTAGEEVRVTFRRTIANSPANNAFVGTTPMPVQGWTNSISSSRVHLHNFESEHRPGPSTPFDPL